MKRAARSALKLAHATRRAEVLATLRLVELAEIAEAEASARANKPTRIRAKTVAQKREDEVSALVARLGPGKQEVRTRSIAQRMAMERGLVTYADGYLTLVDPNQQKLDL